MAHSYGSDELGGGLRVNPAYLEQGQVNTSTGQRRSTHSSSNNSSAQRQYYRERDRRHTLATHAPATAAQYNNQRPAPNEQKRELFMEYLKQKYPEHSNSIEMAKSPDKDSMTFSNGFYDDDGTMSEMDTQATGFQRGGRVRASLPISKTAINKSKEKPLGLVYLNYMSETKRALMPNEVTGIDTVKALFVRAFPRKLSMAMLDSPQRKIYIRDAVTEIFYELENLDEVKDRVVLKIYEPGYVEESSTSIHNSTSTPIDLNVCSDSELADIELPDFRERNYNTVGSKPARTGPDRFDPHMRRPNSTTPMETGNRRMHPQQGRASTGIPQRSPPSQEPFQRGVPERSTAPVRPSSHGPPFSRGNQRLSSTTLPRPQDGRRTPTNTPRSMTMPRAMDKGQVYRPHPENAGRQVEHRIQSTVQTTTMASGPGHEPPRHPSMERPRDPNQPQHHPDFQPPRASTPQQQVGARTLDRSMGTPRGPPQRSSDPRDGPSGPRSGGPPMQQSRDPASRDRSLDSPRRQPPPQGAGSPIKAPRGDMRQEGPPYPRQPPPPEGRSPTRNAAQGMRQPPPNHNQQPNRPQDRTMERPHDRTMDRPRDRSMDRPHDRTMDRPRDRSMDRPRSTPPHRVEQRAHGPPPMKHPHPPQANVREVESRVVRQNQAASMAGPETETSDRISAMEQQIASLAGMVRSALKPGEQPPQGTAKQQQPSPQQQAGPQQRRPQQRLGSEAGAPPGQTPNRSKTELTGVNEEIIRATQNQKTFTSVDSFRDGSDSQSVTPQPMSAMNTRELRNTTMNLKHTVRDLRGQLKQIRKLQLNMVQDMNVAFRATNRKVQLALQATPAGNEHPVRSVRTRTHQDYIKYQMNKDKLDKRVRDLESAVEEMRDDVVNRHCHINLAEVDALAQAIGNSSKHIAEQKVAFPVLADKMKAVMQGEMEIVVTEESFIKDEPGKLDDYMKRCKKVTGTLCTLKRLASVQEHRAPVVPVFDQTSQPVNREALMDTIQHISPNHEERVKNLQAANESRDRKRRFYTAQELRRFQMDLSKGQTALKKTPNLDRINQRRRASLKDLYQSEEHDAMTPILTPEKMAKQATLVKKKVPPPPPPKRTHFSQQAVVTRSPPIPSSPEGAAVGPNLTPKVVVTVTADGEVAPAIPPKPAMMVPKLQQQGSSYTKQTVIYRVGTKPFKTDGQNISSSDEIHVETSKVITTKREVIADSIPVSNGMVHQPVFSQLKVHEMAPRSFATKAKPSVVVNGNGVEQKTPPKPSPKPSPKATVDAQTGTVTNGGGKQPLPHGESEVVEGQGEKVIERTEIEVDKINAVNVNHNGKPQLKTVYTKRLEETFIF